MNGLLHSGGSTKIHERRNPCSVLELPLAIELTVVSVHWHRRPSFIVQCVAENGAADVLYFTRRMQSRLHLAVHSGAVCYTVSCYIVVLLGTLWFCFYVACMLYMHMQPCKNRLIDP